MKFAPLQKWLLAAALMTALVSQTGAQSPPALPSSQETFATLAAHDRALFASVMGSYGHCDTEKFASFFAEDVEFYHDRGGLTRGRAALVGQVKTVCGKQRREVVAGSLEVYPIPGHGAIQLGAHRFFHPPPQPGGAETGGSVAAKFLHIWQFKDGEWKITRVMSYAH